MLKSLDGPCFQSYEEEYNFMITFVPSFHIISFFCGMLTISRVDLNPELF